MKILAAPFTLLLVVCTFAAPNPDKPATISFTNGNWFSGRSFRHRTAYSVDGRLTFRKPAHVDRVVDLKGGFVVPPFGEAHNHNVEPLNKLDPLIQKYLLHGIFYVKNPNNLPTGRDAVLPKINRPDTIDVVFSNGGFTGKDGHPTEFVKRNIERGIWTTDDGDSAFYYSVNNEAELDKKWAEFLATQPDFVKTYLLYSENYAAREDDAKYFGWKGLDPALLKSIVDKAHGAGLRVSTHIESAADFHNALLAKVDEINHMPGFRMNDDLDAHAVSDFEISEADAKLAARQGVYVVTTLGDAAKIDPNGKDGGLRRRQDDLNRRNLKLLQKYHVKLALGSDSYRSDTLAEARYIESLHVFDNRTLLTMWCATTANTIFPHRRIGALKEGYEASFLVLEDNPIKNFSATERIALRVKQGKVLEVSAPQP